MARRIATGTVLTRRQLNRALLARQMLLHRVTGVSVAAALERLVGMQGQTPLSPYTALWSRLEGFDPHDLAGMIEDRSAVRMGLMRTTIHLVTAADALALRPVMASISQRAFATSTPFGRKLAGIDVEAMLADGRALFAERPRTATELRRELAARWPGFDADSLAQGCRYLLPLVQVPPRGVWGRTGQATHTTLETWLGHELPTDTAPDAAVLRYLAAFGPATVSDLRTWSWLTGLREVVERLRPGLVSYRDEQGRELFDVPEGIFADPETPAPPRFLPDYDNLLLSHDDRTRVAPRTPITEDWWQFGALLVDGFGRGTWKLTAPRGADATLDVKVFEHLSPADEADVGAEGERLAGFLAPGRQVDIRIRFEAPDAA